MPKRKNISWNVIPEAGIITFSTILNEPENGWNAFISRRRKMTPTG
jgi:hypothetical protein